MITYITELLTIVYRSKGIYTVSHSDVCPLRHQSMENTNPLDCEKSWTNKILGPIHVFHTMILLFLQLRLWDSSTQNRCTKKIKKVLKRMVWCIQAHTHKKAGGETNWTKKHNTKGVKLKCSALFPHQGRQNKPWGQWVSLTTEPNQKLDWTIMRRAQGVTMESQGKL